MWELGVFSEDKHCMGLMLQNRRSHQQGRATVGQNGAAVAAALERRRRSQLRASKKRKRKVSGEVKVQLQCLLWRGLKKALKASST